MKKILILLALAVVILLFALSARFQDEADITLYPAQIGYQAACTFLVNHQSGQVYILKGIDEYDTLHWILIYPEQKSFTEMLLEEE